VTCPVLEHRHKGCPTPLFTNNPLGNLLRMADNNSNNDGSCSDSDSDSFVHIQSPSKFAKILFKDVEDAHFNDQRLTCKFQLISRELTIEEDDVVALFRVPNVQIDQSLVKIQVRQEDVGEKVGEVAFEKERLPKGNDFYMYQYLKGENVAGASVPFVIKDRKPLPEEALQVVSLDDETLQDEALEDKTLQDDAEDDAEDEKTLLRQEFEDFKASLQDCIREEKEVLQKEDKMLDKETRQNQEIEDLKHKLEEMLKENVNLMQEKETLRLGKTLAEAHAENAKQAEKELKGELREIMLVVRDRNETIEDLQDEKADLLKERRELKKKLESREEYQVYYGMMQLKADEHKFLLEENIKLKQAAKHLHWPVDGWAEACCKAWDEMDKIGVKVRHLEATVEDKDYDIEQLQESLFETEEKLKRNESAHWKKLAIYEQAKRNEMDELKEQVLNKGHEVSQLKERLIEVEEEAKSALRKEEEACQRMKTLVSTVNDLEDKMRSRDEDLKKKKDLQKNVQLLQQVRQIGCEGAKYCKFRDCSLAFNLHGTESFSMALAFCFHHILQHAAC